MNSTTDVSGESFDHKIAAIVDTRNEANAVAQEVVDETSLEQKQVIVVAPDDNHEGRKLEPEDQGIARTAIRAHIRLGIVGVVVGFALFWLLFALGAGLVTNNSLVAALLLMFFGGVFGLLAGGAVTLRPDHAPYLISAQSALSKGQYVVTVHADSHRQMKEAKTSFERRHLKLAASV